MLVQVLLIASPSLSLLSAQTLTTANHVYREVVDEWIEQNAKALEKCLDMLRNIDGDSSGNLQFLSYVLVSDLLQSKDTVDYLLQREPWPSLIVRSRAPRTLPDPVRG